MLVAKPRPFLWSQGARAVMPSFSVVCPSCEAAPTVSKPSLIGKRIACPSCGKPLVIEARADIAREGARTLPPANVRRQAARFRPPGRRRKRRSATKSLCRDRHPGTTCRCCRWMMSRLLRREAQAASTASKSAKREDVPLSKSSSWDDAPLLPLDDEPPRKKESAAAPPASKRRPSSGSVPAAKPARASRRAAGRFRCPSRRSGMMLRYCRSTTRRLPRRRKRKSKSSRNENRLRSPASSHRRPNRPNSMRC